MSQDQAQEVTNEIEFKAWSEMSPEERSELSDEDYTYGLVYGDADADEHSLIDDYLDRRIGLAFAIGADRAQVIGTFEGIDVDEVKYRIMQGLQSTDGEHSPALEEYGDGWNEPCELTLSCRCGADLVGWIQHNPECTGRPRGAELLDAYLQHLHSPEVPETEDSPVRFTQADHDHVAHALTGRYFGGPELKDSIHLSGRVAEQVAATALSAVPAQTSALSEVRAVLQQPGTDAQKLAAITALLGQA